MPGYVKPEMLFFVIIAMFGIAGGWMAANRARNFVGWCLLCALFPVFLMVIYFKKPLQEVEGKFHQCPKCKEFSKWREPVCRYCGTEFSSKG